MTQASIAAALGMPAVTYRSYESGRSAPPFSAFPKLLAAGMDAYYIACGQRFLAAAGEQTDWELVIELAAVIAAWSKQRSRPLESAEQARYLKAGLDWAAIRGADAAREDLARMLLAA